MTRISNADAIAHLKTLLPRAGLRACVAYLNSLTTHRFTSLYRFDSEMLRSLVFYDRENPEVQTCDDIPVLASYCVFVRDSKATFSVDHAREDARVRGHPKRQTLQSYCGVPLINRDGKMFGTICHFDFKPSPIASEDVHLLEYMARLLQDTDL